MLMYSWTRGKPDLHIILMRDEHGPHHNGNLRGVYTGKVL